MRILLLGKNGQLGRELQRALAPLGPVIALGRAEINLEDREAIRRKVRDIKPEIIVNAAAYTNVDRAGSEPGKAHAINADTPGILAEEAKVLSAAFIHYSTDYVFDGKNTRPYTEADAPNPLNVYGASKLAGEQAVQAAGGAHLILRTSWVYSLHGNNFVTKVLEWARQQEILRIVADQIANPTWAYELAEVTAQVLAREAALNSSRRKSHIREHSGLYHLAGTGYVSRFDLAKMILALDPNRSEQLAKKILPVLTSDFSTPAQRPLFSALNCEKFYDLFALRLAPWAEALQLAMSKWVR